MKKLLIFLFVFLFAISPILAVTQDYYYTQKNYHFNDSVGVWNENYESQSVYNIDEAFGYTEPVQAPYVIDLNGDGNLEIVTIDDSIVRILENITMDVLDAYDLGAEVVNPEQLTNMEFIDIDDDNLTEMIIAYGGTIGMEAWVLSYNGSIGLDQQISTTIDGSGNMGGWLVCDDTQNLCMLAGVDAGALFNIECGVFNATNMTIDQAICDDVFNTDISPHAICPPRIKVPQYVDYDNDGTKEFIISYLVTDSGADDKLIVSMFTFNSTNVTGESQFSKGSLDVPDSVGNPNTCYDTGNQDFITSPLCLDFDGATGTGIECVVGVMTSNTGFKMYSIKPDGTELDDYPETANADGVLLGNLIQMDGLTDTDDNDVCALGYSQSESQLTLLCANEQSAFSGQNKEYDIDVADIPTYYDMSFAPYADYHTMGHAMETKSGGDDLEEVLTPYGIFMLDEGVVDATLEFIWSYPHLNATIIPIDLEDEGSDDFLAFGHTVIDTQFSLWYIDDDIFNAGCTDDGANCIKNVNFNPPPQNMQNQTSSQVSILLEDLESDAISRRVYWYRGDANEILQNWSVPIASGNTIIASVTMNKTISDGIISIQARSVGNLDKIEEINFTFSVSESGIEFGEADQDYSFIPATDEQVNETNTTESGSILDNFDQVSSFTGIGTTLLWIILMGGVAFFILTYDSLDSSTRFSMTIGSMGLMTIMGVFFGFLGTGLMIIILVIGIIMLGVAFRNTFTGG